MLAGDAILSWVHFGDLHITQPGEQNHRDLQALIAAANANLVGATDFAVLLGDNADDGTDAQFTLVRDAVSLLRLPLHILPGDHDFKPRNLDAFHRVLGAPSLPKALSIAGVRCLFLDVVSAGTGGPDFRLDAEQLGWLARELAAADRAGQRGVIFMHTYPADLTQGADALCALIARHRVLAVDMGHTHYNELANDGHTIYAATRSTGQIEEGPVGFSIAAVDRGAVSWRFKPLVQAWPFVLITSPADMRLVTDPRALNQVPRGLFDVRAQAWSGKAVAAVACRIDDGEWQAMSAAGNNHALSAAGNNHALWVRRCVVPDGAFALTVRAEDADGNTDQETIHVAGGHYEAPARHDNGSDADAVGAWPEKGILGTQLGPNRNGRKW